MRIATLLMASAFLASPAAAGESDRTDAMAEPAKAAVPVDVQQWQRRIARDLHPLRRFVGLPQMRLGLVVDTRGAVTSCRALPLEEGGVAKGQGLCPLVVEHARFQPALDQAGNPVASIFIARFGKSRAVNATDGMVL